MLKIKPIQKNPFFRKPSKHMLCITFPHVLLITNAEQQSKVKLDHVGPRYSQNKVSTPSFVMIIRLCQCSICTLPTTVRARVRRSARRNDARQLRYVQICTLHMQYLTVSISNDRSETGFELSAKKWSRNNCTYNVCSSFQKSRF
jgi:hypothetical protein